MSFVIVNVLNAHAKPKNYKALVNLNKVSVITEHPDVSLISFDYSSNTLQVKETIEEIINSSLFVMAEK